MPYVAVRIHLYCTAVIFDVQYRMIMITYEEFDGLILKYE